MIFHIATRPDWQAAQQSGLYRPAAFRTDGFIHCSSVDQVPIVADRFFDGRRDLLLLYIEESRLTSELRWESSADVLQSLGPFPHVYGPLNVDAAVRVLDFVPGADGHFSAPAFS